MSMVTSCRRGGTTSTRVDMKRFILPIAIVIVIVVGLALLTEGSAIVPFLYRNF
jgi:hypothetical protein